MKKVNLTTATLAILAGVLTAPTITNAENSTETGSTIDAVEQVNTEAKEIESEETSDEATQDRGIVDEAKLIAQKKAAIEEINNMTELTDLEKAEYTAKILASGSEGVSNTLEAAEAKNQERLDIKEAEKALAEAKEKAEYAISQLYYDGKLSEDETFGFLEEARNAKDVAEVDAAIAKAETKAAENAANTEAEKALAEAKEKAEYAISQLYHEGKISEDDAQAFVEEARNATDIAGVDAAIAKAEAKAAENAANSEAEKALAEAKEKAEYAISQLYYDGKLSEDETFEFLEEARNAKDVAGVELAIAKAEAKAAENAANSEAERALAEAKLKAEYAISQLYYDGKLSEDETFEFLEEARNAKDVAGVELAIAKAEAKAAENAANSEAEKALAEAKLKAEYAISQLYYDGKLSEDETFEFLEEARNAKDVAGVEAAIAKAEAKAAENVALAKAKEKAKNDLKAALDKALETTLKGRLTNSEKQNALLSIYELAIKDIEAATSQEEIDAIVDAALKSFSEISSEKVDEVKDADDYINSIYGGDLLTANQKDKLDNQIKEANSVQELDAVKRKAFRQGRKNAIAFAQRQLDAGNINQGDFDFFESEYNKLRYTGNMSDADAINAITANMLELIAARQTAENVLALYLADGWITLDEYNALIERINNVHSAQEVMDIMDEVSMDPDNERPIDPMDPDNERPIDPMDPDNERPTINDSDEGKGNPAGNSNKPGTVISTSKPSSSNSIHSGSGKNTGSTSKNATSQLPKTGEELRNGMVAGGLASVLGSAALFFRKPR